MSSKQKSKIGKAVIKPVSLGGDLMNIAVIGLGGVGGYFGAKLCRQAESSDDKVHFIARGAHLAAIVENGLRVKTSEEGEWVCRPTSASLNIEALFDMDLILVCVKSYDLEDVARRLQTVVRPDTIILPLLNGVDIYERMQRVLTTGIIYPACVFVGTHIESPGVISQNGGARKIQFGAHPLQSKPVPSFIPELFHRAQINFEHVNDPMPSIWSKFVFIAAYGIVTAAYDKPLDEIVSAKPLSDKVRSIMKEVAALAKAQGVILSGDVVELSFQKGADFAPGTKTSLQRDVEKPNAKDERDLFGGTILRMGKALGIPSPVTEEVWSVLEQRKPSAR
jgi:2-dehydropantoate 2-reductase